MDLWISSFLKSLPWSCHQQYLFLAWVFQSALWGLGFLDSGLASKDWGKEDTDYLVLFTVRCPSYLFNALKDPYFPYSAFCCWYTCKSPTCCPWFPWCAWWSWLSLILFFFFIFLIPTYHITTMLFVHQPCVSSIHRTDGYPHPPSSFLDLFWDQTKPIGKNIFTSLRGCTSCLSLTDSDPQIRSHGHWNKAHLLMPVPRPIIDVSYQCPPSHILILSFLWKLMKTDCSEMHSWKNLKINSS